MPLAEQIRELKPEQLTDEEARLLKAKLERRRIIMNSRILGKQMAQYEHRTGTKL